MGIFRYWPENVPESVAGIPRILDGDSIRINGEEVRLVGIDAPERRQMCQKGGRNWACGVVAAEALREYVAGRPVSCAVEGVDKYDRLLGRCQSSISRELNGWMVEQGWAVSFGDYHAAEQRARAARRGIWGSTFERPRNWRDEHLKGVASDAAS